MAIAKTAQSRGAVQWRRLGGVVIEFAAIIVWFGWGHRWLDAVAYAGPPPTYATVARWECALANLSTCAVVGAAAGAVPLACGAESCAWAGRADVAPAAAPRAPAGLPRLRLVEAAPLDRRAAAFAFGVVEYGSDRERGQLVLDAAGLVASGHVRLAANASAAALWGELRVPTARPRHWLESLLGWPAGAAWDYWFVHAVLNLLLVS